MLLYYVVDDSSRAFLLSVAAALGTFPASAPPLCTSCQVLCYSESHLADCTGFLHCELPACSPITYRVELTVTFRSCSPSMIIRELRSRIPLGLPLLAIYSIRIFLATQILTSNISLLVNYFFAWQLFAHFHSLNQPRVLNISKNFILDILNNLSAGFLYLNRCPLKLRHVFND